MTTTDRMGNLDSRREIVDRVGETVVLGNSVGSAALDAPATIAMGAAGKSEATGLFDMDAAASVDFQNASFGIWAVFLDIDAAALFAAAGGSIRSAPINSAATSLFTAKSNAGGLIGVQVKTATGVYTPTAGTVSIVVEAVGGGGGGGGVAQTSISFAGAAGGGSGAIAIGRITSGFSGVTVTIGAGGAGGAAGNNVGTAGGATTFGSVLSAGGGAGGNGDPAGGVPRGIESGDGGAASGSASIAGFRGKKGNIGWAIVNSSAFGGWGGSTPYGAGGGENLSAGAGFNASGFGGGGGGAANANGGGAPTAAAAGGNGSPGLCIIYEYNI